MCGVWGKSSSNESRRQRTSRSQTSKRRDLYSLGKSPRHSRTSENRCSKHTSSSRGSTRTLYTSCQTPPFIDSTPLSPSTTE